MISAFALKRKLPVLALLVVASTSLFSAVTFGAEESIEASTPSVLSLPTTPGPVQPTSPMPQRAGTGMRKVLRQRQHLDPCLRFAARTGMTDFTIGLRSMKARAETDATDTEPRYLKIFLLATPDNHRSPPLA